MSPTALSFRCLANDCLQFFLSPAAHAQGDFTVRTGRAVIEDFIPLVHFAHYRQCLRREIKVPETLPNIIHPLFRNMQHIFGIKTVIPQFVHHNLIRREIGNIIKTGCQPVGSKEKNRLAQLIPMCPVLPMTDGTDRNKHLQSRTQRP